MDTLYEKSYKALKKITKEYGEYPTRYEWNKYAKEYNLLNCKSLQYISGLDWHAIMGKIYSELHKRNIKFLT